VRARAALALVAMLWLPAGAAAQAPDRIGPFWIGDATARVRPSLFAQLQLEGQTRADADFEVRPRLRRIRPILRGSFLDGRITATLHLEVSPESPELIDAWIEGAILPALRLRVGQLKTPFTEYYQRSLTELAVDWPLTSRWFGGERQLGLMAHGADPGTGLSYAAGAFAGQNRRSAFARELPRLVGLEDANPSSLSDPAPTEPIHAELFARVGHAPPGWDPRTRADVEGGELRHSVALSVAWDTDPVPGRDFALRVAPEVTLKHAGVTVLAVGYLGWVDGDEAPGAVGVLGEVAWRADRHLELTARYARVHVLPVVMHDAANLDAPHASHEATVAVGVPILGRSLIWETDVAWLRAERSTGRRDDLRVRSQLQLAF